MNESVKKQKHETDNLTDYMKAGGQPDSSTNQRIRDKLVGREVLCCASMLVSELARSDGFMEDEDLMTLCCAYDYEEPCREHGWVAYADLRDEQQLAATEKYGSDDDPAYVRLDDDEVDEVSDVESWQELCEEQRIDPDDREVFEHWIVRDWFADKLKDQGEVTGDLMGLTIWGRCCSGQSISMDNVIAEIAAGMQILEGQRNTWDPNEG